MYESSKWNQMFRSGKVKEMKRRLMKIWIKYFIHQWESINPFSSDCGAWKLNTGRIKWCSLSLRLRLRESLPPLLLLRCLSSFHLFVWRKERNASPPLLHDSLRLLCWDQSLSHFSPPSPSRSLTWPKACGSTGRRWRRRWGPSTSGWRPASSSCGRRWRNSTASRRW